MGVREFASMKLRAGNFSGDEDIAWIKVRPSKTALASGDYTGFLEQSLRRGYPQESPIYENSAGTSSAELYEQLGHHELVMFGFPQIPLHKPSVHVISHVLFHLILHYWG